MSKSVGIIVYGAYGQIGKAVTLELLKQGIYPLLAGRNLKKLKQIANKTNLPYVCFDVINFKTIERHLEDAEIFINCAGSLVNNPEPIARAAINSHCHYLDVGGQYHTLTTLYSLSDIAKEGDSVICAGIGAECIPGDCLAGSIKHNLKELTNIEIAYDISHRFSAGSIKATLNRLSRGNIQLTNHSPETTKYSFNAKRVLFASRLKHVSQVPSGDLAAIHRSTQCPNIRSYFAITKQFTPIVRLLNWFPGLLISKPLHQMIDKLFSHNKGQPSGISHYWAKGISPDEREMVARVSTPDIYQFTVDATIYIAGYLLKHDRSGGVYTPTELMTWKLVENIPGCSSIRFGDMYG